MVILMKVLIILTIRTSRLTSSQSWGKCLRCVVDERLSMVQYTNFTKPSDARKYRVSLITAQASGEYLQISLMILLSR